jgi:CRP-like cAMP-binding protein
MEKVTDLIKSSDLFIGLPEEKIETVLAIGEVKVFGAGENIIAEGELSGELYLVQEGLVEVLVPSGAVADVAGAPQLSSVVQLGRGQIFGEMALVDRGVRSATVRCVEDGTTLFVIERDAFRELCESDHHIGHVVMRNLARDLSFKLRHRNLRSLTSR